MIWSRRKPRSITTRLFCRGWVGFAPICFTKQFVASFACLFRNVTLLLEDLTAWGKPTSDIELMMAQANQTLSDRGRTGRTRRVSTYRSMSDRFSTLLPKSSWWKRLCPHCLKSWGSGQIVRCLLGWRLIGVAWINNINLSGQNSCGSIWCGGDDVKMTMTRTSGLWWKKVRTRSAPWGVS
jgi:hypothetical protein